MLYYERIDISKGTDPTKNNNSRECMICHYFFFNHVFKFQDSVCNGCHHLSKTCFNIKATAVIIIENVDYCCIIHNIKVKCCS